MAPTIKSTLLATVAALLLLSAVVAPVPRAAAMEEWCDTDPPVAITTPGGNTVVVYALSGAQNLTAALLAEASQISYTVAPANGGAATLVTLSVTVRQLPTVPAGTPTRVKVTSAPWGLGTLYGDATGTVGAPMVVRFRLNVP